MARIIVITGTPGAGKTAVLQEAIKDRDDVKVTNYADNMIAAGKEMGIGDDHDALRKLPVEKQHELQKLAAERIVSEAADVTIVDTHATIQTAEGYIPGLPEDVVTTLKPEVIVIIDASPEEIEGRRKSDTSRQRDADSIEGIKRHQEANKEAAETAAGLVGATVKVIYNHDNKLGEAAEELLALL